MTFSTSKCYFQENIAQMMKYRAGNISTAIIQEVRYWPSNGANANVIRRDLYRYFRRHTNIGIRITFNIWKTTWASKKSSGTTFLEADTNN